MNISIVLRILLFVAFLLLIDWYAFQAVKTVFKESNLAKYVYWGTSILVLGLLIYVFLNFDRSKPQPAIFQYFAGLLILFLVPKLVVIAVLFGEDLIRFFVGIGGKISGSREQQFLPDRRTFVSTTALALASIPFLGIIHGIWKGRYNYRVVKKTLRFANLPDAFDGFTITQISDVHSGSFDNAEKIQYGIDLINQQESDLLLFTGDLVNNRAEEMEPWIDTFKQLKAPMGKFSILGNHDYGDYVEWPSAEAKQENMRQLYKTHEQIGFNLLRNESVKLEKGGSKIDLIGVENWGTGFAQHGDLEKATTGLNPKDFKVLMSHDPSHFDAQVKTHPQDIELTLSGHTHGMQFGIEIPGFIKWSPVKYRYPKWAGLYESAGKSLYVNRGFGFLAFPGRVGIWPEITVLELRKA
jgi:predicted MPP superfamily phosphohydrolase